MLKTSLFIVFLYIGGFAMGQSYPDLRYYEKGNINLFYSHETEDNPIFDTFLNQARNKWINTHEVLPSYHATRDAIQMQYTTLEEFESEYIKIGMKAPHNYGWYQFKFHHDARHLYNEGGAEVIKKLCHFLGKYQEKLSDKDLIKKLGGSTSLFLGH